MLTVEQYDDIRVRLADGCPPRQIESDTGISRQTIWRIASGKMTRPKNRDEYTCDGCGKRVIYKPCRICATREYIRKRRVLDARAADIRKQQKEATQQCVGPTD